MAKQPTTTPRWQAYLTHGALIITIMAAAIAYGRSASRTEAALKNYTEVPKIQANVESVNQQLDKIEKMIKEQGDARVKDNETRDKRLDGLQSQITTLAQLDTRVTAISGQMGTIFALSMSNSKDVSELKGTLKAILEQQRKDK